MSYTPKSKRTGEVWEVHRLNYDTQKFEKIGEMTVMYKDIQEWLEGRKRIGGWIKEFLRRYAEEHGLQGETLVRTVKEYI